MNRAPGPLLDALAHSDISRRLRRLRARGDARWVDRLPPRVRARLDLDGEPVRPLRLEIGGGPLPRPGYVHLDSDPGARHLEHLAPAWQLPLQTSTVDELLAIHVFEHVHPAYLQQTLADWLRVLRSGGVAEIHVPNAAAILPAYLEGDPATKWAAMAAIYGMPCDPARLEPGARENGGPQAEHRALYDFAMLETVLREAGFAAVEDLTDTVSDRHTEGWKQEYGIEKLSLIVRATAA